MDKEPNGSSVFFIFQIIALALIGSFQSFF